MVSGSVLGMGGHIGIYMAPGGKVIVMAGEVAGDADDDMAGDVALAMCTEARWRLALLARWSCGSRRHK